MAPVANGAQQIALGNGVLALVGPWKFRVGDNLAWAQRGFDDSGWQDYTLEAQGWPESIYPARDTFDPGWGGHGYRGDPKYGWYRIHVRLDRAPGSLSLLVPAVDSAYTVYWDGQKLGGYGDPSRRWAYFIQRTQLFPIPSSPGTAEDHVLAVRVWDMPLVFTGTRRGGLRGVPLLADGATASRIKQLSFRLDQLSLAVTATTEVLPYLLVALISLLLFFYRRNYREYLWTGLTLLSLTSADLLLVLDGFSATGWLTQTQFYSANVLGASVFLSSLPALQWLLGLEDRPRMRIANLIAGSLTFLFWAGFTVNGEWLASSRAHTILLIATDVSILPCMTCILWMAVAGVRKLGREAWLMLSPGAVISAMVLWQVFATGRLPLPVLNVVTDVLTILVPASVLAILLYRFVRQWREHQRIEGELQQAQAMQRILVPTVPRRIPGFEIASVYLPASEVGGDFFQISPADDGSLLIVVGDVSGKGLKAAMTVSTIVGALRNELSRRPAQVLTNLNRVLHGEIDGFVTCCAAHIADDGAMTLANAGQISPYRNGEESPTENGLPLGMIAGIEYEETRIQLLPGDRLTFVSDGVVEATSKSGELFGFDRTQAISTQDAVRIAETAKQFGQQDDITVVSVEFSGCAREMASA